MVTIKEIADRCGVSPTTVSNVINGKAKTSRETQEKILAAIEETGYKPNYVAKGLRMQRTRIIAIIAEDIAQFTSPPVIESIMEYSEEHDYRVTVRNLRLYARWGDTWYDSEEAYHSIVDPVLQDVLSARVEGVIYLAGHARIIRCFDEMLPFPAVMCYAFSDSAKVPSVVIDDEKSACEIVSLLLNKGHERIGFIGGKQENIHTQQRLIGYQRALFEHGVPFDPDLVYYGEWTRESGWLGAETLSARKPSAFFAISDKMAGGVYDYLNSRKIRIGREISVAGFDDESIAAYFNPPLTTTALPLSEIGQCAAELLIDRIEGEQEENTGEPDVRRFPCHLVKRSSIG